MLKKKKVVYFVTKAEVRNGAKENHKKVAISKQFVLVFVEVFVV
jgi:hypothetical protein